MPHLIVCVPIILCFFIKPLHTGKLSVEDQYNCYSMLSRVFMCRTETICILEQLDFPLAWLLGKLSVWYCHKEKRSVSPIQVLTSVTWICLFLFHMNSFKVLRVKDSLGSLVLIWISECFSEVFVNLIYNHSIYRSDGRKKKIDNMTLINNSAICRHVISINLLNWAWKIPHRFTHPFIH